MDYKKLYELGIAKKKARYKRKKIQARKKLLIKKYKTIEKFIRGVNK